MLLLGLLCIVGGGVICCWLIIIYFAPFSLEFLFPGYSSWFYMYMREVTETTSAFPSHLEPERNNWERNGRSRTYRFYSNGAVTTEESWLAEKYGPYLLRLCSRTTSSREGGSRGPAAALSKEHHPTEGLLKYHQSPSLPCSPSSGDPLLPPTPLISNHTPTLSTSWPISRKAEESGSF